MAPGQAKDSKELGANRKLGAHPMVCWTSWGWTENVSPVAGPVLLSSTTRIGRDSSQTSRSMPSALAAPGNSARLRIRYLVSKVIGVPQ